MLSSHFLHQCIYNLSDWYSVLWSVSGLLTHHWLLFRTWLYKMSRSLSGRTSTMIIASLVSLVMCVVMWRMTQSSLQRPLYPTKKSVPLLSSLDESLTRDNGNTTTQHTALLTELSILPTEVYVEHDKSLSIPEYAILWIPQEEGEASKIRVDISTVHLPSDSGQEF